MGLVTRLEKLGGDAIRISMAADKSRAILDRALEEQQVCKRSNCALFISDCGRDLFECFRLILVPAANQCAKLSIAVSNWLRNMINA
jgi:hypothetical protein